MDILTIKVSVCGITHMFKLDGSIIPLIDIFPPIRLQDGSDITRIVLPKDTKKSDVDIAAKDKLEIKLYNDLKKTVEVKIIERSESSRRKLTEPICPICGSPLMKSMHPGAIGRCINRSCMAQMTPTIFNFLSELNVIFKYPLNRILECLLVRGSLTSLATMFYLTIDDLISPTCGMMEAQLFIYQLHDIRGRTSVDSFLKGLRIPDWDEKNILMMADIFAKEEWGISQLTNFLDPNIQKQYTTIDWKPWEQFFSLESNKSVMVELCHILNI